MQFATLAALSVLAPATPTTWYVSAGACPGPGSGAAGDPFCSIHAAIDAASSGDTVLVAPGTYPELLDFGDKNIVVRSDQDGNPETADPSPTTTILDGGGSGPIVRIVGSVHTNATVLEGFTLQNGATNGNGGAVSAIFGGPTIRGNIIRGNTATGSGGGIASAGPSALIEGNLIEDNVANGGGPDAGGGGIWLRFSDGTVVRNNTVCGNIARHGGGISTLDSPGTVSVHSNWIYDNTAFDFGGGVNSRGRTSIRDNVIAGNHANTYGGAGVFVFASHAELVDNLIVANVSSGQFGFGGGCMADSVSIANTMSLVGNTIVRNTATGPGGALHVTVNSNVAVSSCILWNNSAPSGAVGFVGTNCALTVDYSDLQGGAAAIDSMGSVTIGPGVIDQDPMFVDPVGPDGLASTWNDNDYHLQDVSPCVDSGDNSTFPTGITEGLDGLSRYCDVASAPDTGIGPAPVVDMGTYEVQGLGCAQVVGCGTNPEGSLVLVAGVPRIGDVLELQLDDPAHSLGIPSATVLVISDAPVSTFPPCGLIIPGWGLAGPGTSGELIVSLDPPNPQTVQSGPMWQGTPVTIIVPVPNDAAYLGLTFYAQAVFLTFGQGRIALTEALVLPIGM